MKTKNKYSLPFREDAPAVAVSNPDSHPPGKKLEHAVDFLLERDEPILAVADGIVIEVKDDSTEGGPAKKFEAAEYQNFVKIEHKNGEYSQYDHLAHDSVLVEEGDQVKEGQPIANGIDAIGCTTALHLHFEVFGEDDYNREIGWKGKSPRIFNGKTDKEEMWAEIERINKGLESN